MSAIRVMVVEDSPTVNAFLCDIIRADPRLDLCAAAQSGEEALRLIERVAPDVISLDIRLPGMSGLELAEHVMSRRPTPIVVVAASETAGEQALSVRALAAGALSVVDKPGGGPSPEAYRALADKICTQLAIMSQVKVVRQRFRAPALRAGAAAPPPAPGMFEAVGIVCSTGGPQALVKIFSGLGMDFGASILLVQHITPSFFAGFAAWLASACPLPVEIVAGRSKMVAGRIYLAAPDLHLKASRGVAYAEPGEPVAGHRPSGTALFQSLAEHLGPRAVGALLTGMGEDGAEGLLTLKKAGGYTLVENERTAVVYGMPAAAARLEAERESLSLDEIARRLRELVMFGEAAV
jgi:two-component system chemotaxis response regulator CheB